MKKNIYFIIAAGIVIIFSIYNILNVDSIIANTINSYKSIGIESSYTDEIIKTFENSGGRLIVVSSIICIASCLGIMLLSIKDKLTKRKNLALFLTILTFLLSPNDTVSLISVINFIILINTKGNSVKEKKKIPNMVFEKPAVKERLLGLLLILAYFSQFIWGDYIPNNHQIKIIIGIAFYVLILSLSIFIFYQELKKGFTYLKNNSASYIKFLLIAYVIGFIIYYIARVISVLLTNQLSTINDVEVKSQPIWLLIPLAIIWAPIVEETIFRGAIRRFITNEKVFIVVSAVIFGLLHTLGEATIFNTIVLALPYAVLGALLAYVYVKTNNITCNILLHSLHNTIAVLFTIMFI